MTRPIESSFKLPAVAWPPVDFGGCIAVLAARRQMVLLYGLVLPANRHIVPLPYPPKKAGSRYQIRGSAMTPAADRTTMAVPDL